MTSKPTYKSKTYDWAAMYGGLIKIIREITSNQVPIFSDANVKDHGDYPFIVLSDGSPYREAYYSKDKQHDIFYKQIVIDCWAETVGESQSIADDLKTLLTDPVYKNQLRGFGITFQSISNYFNKTEQTGYILGASCHGFTLEIQLERNYRSSIQDLNTFIPKGDFDNGTK